MRNYLVFGGDSLLPFQYPEDREIEVGTELVLETDSTRDLAKSVTSIIKVKINRIIKQENKKRILYYCEIV